MSARHTRSLWLYGLEWTILITIMILATFLRYWRIEEVPPGFNSDEAVGAIGALTTLRDGIQYSYEGQGGGGALGFYFAAAAFYLFGPSIATMRGLAAWASLVGLFAHYWAVREVFRTPTGSPKPQFLTNLNQARLIAILSTLGLAVSGWHLQVSRVAFAGIGVPFLMMPSVYFLWLGLNRHQAQASTPNRQGITAKWPFIVSGIFLGGLMYIYLSGMFVPPFYAAFFISQWLIIIAARRLGNRPWIKWQLEPAQALMTSQFWNLFATGLTAAILLLPIIFVLLTRPEIDPSTTRVSQASFLNPTINNGDPWGLLWRSITGNFWAFGISPAWLVGQVPARLAVAPIIGFLTFAGFIVALWRGLRGQAAYLFVWLWFIILLLPSILAPDAIPHTLRAIGASNATYILAAMAIVTLFELIWWLGRQVLAVRLSPPLSTWVTRGIGLIAGLVLLVVLWQSTASRLYGYFYLFPETNDAKAAYHVYAVEMANEINRESRPDAAFILPRNTAAGEVFKNFTTEFLLELE
ncbi:MAG: hypothetical protein R3264_06225, partial [Anaerolineae bacterium]|nr:hypothetical protein [Anaerolineae bacterium]